VQWIRYEREYYRTADGKVRITMDRGLEAFDLRLSTRVEDRWPSRLPRILVVEVKCSRDHAEEASHVVNGIPMFVDRCSKFVLASDRANGPVSSIVSD